MATPAAIADFHQKLRPDTFWQKLCLVILCFSSTAPAMDLAGFGDMLPDWPLIVYVVLSSMVGAFVGFTYYPQWRYGIVGVLPGLLAGPCVLLLTYFYTLPRETVYKAEMALVWVVGMTPAALMYYVAMRLIVLSTSRAPQPEAFTADPFAPHGSGIPSTWQQMPAATVVEEPARTHAPVAAAATSADWSAAAYSAEPPAAASPARQGLLLAGIGIAVLSLLALAAILWLGSRPRAPRQPIGPVAAQPQQQKPEVPQQKPAAPKQKPIAPKQKPVAPAAVPVQAPAANQSLDAAAIAQLAADLSSGQKSLQRAAAQKLSQATAGEQDREPVAAALAPLLNDPDFVLRRSAAQALGNWGTANSVPALIAALEHDDFAMRRQVIESFGKLNDPQAAEPLVARLAVGSDRTQAAAALRAIGAPAEDAVQTALDHSDVFARVEACRILETIGTEKSLEKLEAAALDKNGLVKSAARQAVQAIKTR